MVRSEILFIVSIILSLSNVSFILFIFLIHYHIGIFRKYRLLDILLHALVKGKAAISEAKLPCILRIQYPVAVVNKSFSYSGAKENVTVGCLE